MAARLSEQARQVDVGKLVVTFSTAVSAGLVGAALQLGYSSDAWWMIGVFAVGSLLTVLTFLVDRLVAPEISPILADLSLSDAARLSEFRRSAYTALLDNESVVRSTRVVASLQMAAAVACWGLAITWLIAHTPV